MAKYINADTVISLLEREAMHYNGAIRDVVERLIGVVKVLKDEELDRNHGIWLKRDGRPLAQMVVCSNCNGRVRKTFFKGIAFEMKYCPYCGARMEGEE